LNSWFYHSIEFAILFQPFVLVRSLCVKLVTKFLQESLQSIISILRNIHRPRWLSWCTIHRNSWVWMYSIGSNPRPEWRSLECFRTWRNTQFWVDWFGSDTLLRSSQTWTRHLTSSHCPHTRCNRQRMLAYLLSP